jgi:N6-L-threonylcarbamoyladenine synthase
MPRILGIESTCDETAAAVVEGGARVLSNVVSSQIQLHARYRGVVPEIASRAHIESILPVIHDALAQAGLKGQDIDAVAVTHRPGLIGSLLIGVTAAKTLAWSLGKPLIGVDHVQAHLYSMMLRGTSETDAPTSASSDFKSQISHFPAVGLAISGGHNALYRLTSFADMEMIGSTIDDAVGEAYDKVSFILGLGYPGGPIIDALAAQGDPAAIRFPRSTLGRDSLDFSFSGVKTSVLYHVRGKKGKERMASDLSQQEIADVAAGFQAACIDVILTKLKRAIRPVHARCVIIGGGVSANRGLRAAVGALPVPVYFPNPSYCTDNAAMAAGLAHEKLLRGELAGLDLDAITHSQFARKDSTGPATANR